MPQIEIRQLTTEDIPALANINHTSQTDYVWQMERLIEEGQFDISFRAIRLPRAVTVEAPIPEEITNFSTSHSSKTLVSIYQQKPVGYICIKPQKTPGAAWVTGIAVDENLRRKGIASALILAAQDWASHQNIRRVILEMQSKNHPASQLALKLGYDFCGFHDHYYSNQDIALFFSRFLR